MKQEQIGSEKAQGYTFGVEIECYLPAERMRRLNIQVGSYHRGYPLPAPFPAGWTAQYDASLHTDRVGYKSIEIVSPILEGRAGIEQVKQVAKTIQNLGGAVNDRCGVHVHVGINSVVAGSHEQAEWVAKLMYQVAEHEKALYAQTGTHRRESGEYCRSIKADKRRADRIRSAKLEDKAQTMHNEAGFTSRYQSLNLRSILSPRGTVEFRAFAGTIDWVKLVGHVCTALALCEKATEAAKMDWEGLASERTYGRKGEGAKALSRFLSLAGWTKGRRHVGKPKVEMAGWIADLADLKVVKAELTRLARKYDEAGS